MDKETSLEIDTHSSATYHLSSLEMMKYSAEKMAYGVEQCLSAKEVSNNEAVIINNKGDKHVKT